jgi:hypothetical protein
MGVGAGVFDVGVQADDRVVVDDDRYPFPKIRVIDPQDDWPAALARIGAAVRPS